MFYSLDCNFVNGWGYDNGVITAAFKLQDSDSDGNNGNGNNGNGNNGNGNGNNGNGNNGNGNGNNGNGNNGNGNGNGNNGNGNGNNGNAKSPSSRVLIWVEICRTVYVGVEGHEGPQTYCKIVAYEVDPNANIDGGGGGFNPPPDSGGGGLGGGNNGTNNPPPQTTCDKINAANDSVASYYANSDFEKSIDSLETYLNATATSEQGFPFGYNTDGNFVVLPIITSSEGASVSLPYENTSDVHITGGAHTHLSDYYDAQSQGDIYGLISRNISNPNYIMNIAYGANNSGTYLLTVTNPSLASSFRTNYPEATYFDTATGGWKLNTSIYDDEEDLIKYFQSLGQDKNTAYVTDEGEWRRIFLE
jgi:hypothetical protein